ncbi:flagellar hook protein FlgE [Chromatocurvus halotolerans]|uniref:Flagellar hook protein FlgE n=1 Tax=Chromatocurvus halotolerans TaxID=1132028 RepID=A0A4R2KQR8_9GAMM|nr:flagellar hook protein FlgE [Chromatocurvus halotolerans]TCO76621.1 flagellar hook protein FlgE [Chromatocurvus halotolerans]
MPFQIALSGLNAANTDLKVTSNNIANVNTTGFKQSRANFAELFAAGLQSVTSSATGLGTRLSSIQQQFSQGTIDFTGNNLDMAIVGDGFFTLSDSGAQSYTRAGAFNVDRNGFVVNADGLRLQAFPPAGDSFNTAELTDLQLVTANNPPRASEVVTAGLNLPADAEPPGDPLPPLVPADPTTFNHTTSLSVIDSLGGSNTASYYFVKGAADNAWQVSLYVNGDPVGGAEDLEFDALGNLTVPAGGEIVFPPVDPGNGAEDLELTTNFSDTTQFGDRFSINELSQDGFESGRLTGIDISQEGIVFARFTNGQANPLGKLAMANFANVQGLANNGNTTFTETFASGQALLGEAGTSNFGLVESGALEASNVDLTAELVQMITAQRNFQANAQMISTADTVTQTIINIR